RRDALGREVELAGLDGPVDAETQVVGERDLGDQDFDEDLARLTIELFDGRLDLRPVARERRHDDGVRRFVGDEPDLAFEHPQLPDTDACAGERGSGPRGGRWGRKRWWRSGLTLPGLSRRTG